MRARWLLLALLFLAACAVNYEEAQHQGFVYSAAQDTEDYNDKPQESYPGQASWDGHEWHLEGE